MTNPASVDNYNLRPLSPNDAIEDIFLVAANVEEGWRRETLRDAATLLKVYMWVYYVNAGLAFAIFLGLIYLGFRAALGK